MDRKLSNALFKFQYDNTLSQAHQAQPIQTHKFKFQYDNTLRKRALDIIQQLELI